MSRNLSVLRTKVTERDASISLLKERINTYQVLSANYEKQLSNQEQQLKLSTGLNETLAKQVKRQRTKTVLVGIAGLIVSGFTLYLSTK